MLADAISVADMVASWPEASSIRIQLDQILATRTAQNVQAFVQTTNVDWLLDAKTTSLLFQLLTTIRDRLPSDSGGGGV
ncbi:MAG: hypothetical protein FJ112_10165 [Deltaproteobacteria bacterium]|nr:hypothetical protein [Deltaproteobacteria bacterium]